MIESSQYAWGKDTRWFQAVNAYKCGTSMLKLQRRRCSFSQGSDIFFGHQLRPSFSKMQVFQTSARQYEWHHIRCPMVDCTWANYSALRRASQILGYFWMTSSLSKIYTFGGVVAHIIDDCLYRDALNDWALKLSRCLGDASHREKALIGQAAKNLGFSVRLRPILYQFQLLDVQQLKNLKHLCLLGW